MTGKITKVMLMTAAAMLATGKAAAQQVAPTTSDSVATVYFIQNITPENLVKIYDALDRKASGRVCVKLSSGEKGNPNHLSPASPLRRSRWSTGGISAMP